MIDIQALDATMILLSFCGFAFLLSDPLLYDTHSLYFNIKAYTYLHSSFFCDLCKTYELTYTYRYYIVTRL